MTRTWHVTLDELLKVVPDGYKLAVLRLPIFRKFALTWWVDESGKIAKSDRKAKL